MNQAQRSSEPDIIRELRRRHITGLDELLVLCPDSWEALYDVFDPPRAVLRKRLATAFPSEDELIAWWLAEAPGARKLHAHHGRASLIVLARQRRLTALDAAERALTNGATWLAAERLADRALRTIELKALGSPVARYGARQKPRLQPKRSPGLPKWNRLAPDRLGKCDRCTAPACFGYVTGEVRCACCDVTRDRRRRAARRCTQTTIRICAVHGPKASVRWATGQDPDVCARGKPPPNMTGAWRFGSRSDYIDDMFIDAATGTPWEHETLYRTNDGRWFAHRITAKGYSRRVTWRCVTPKAAWRWLRCFGGGHDRLRQLWRREGPLTRVSASS